MAGEDGSDFNLNDVRRRLYSPDALEQYRELGYLEDPTTKEFPRFQTRFGPTANGPLHVGSALCLLMNYIWARISGTRIFLRYETQDMCDWTIPQRDPPSGNGETERSRKLVAEDLDWLGVADRVEEVEPLGVRGQECSERIYDWLTGYQAQPGLDIIAQEIARLDDDHRLGVNMLVRGWDLYGVSYLYFALARRVHGTKPFFTFVPVLCDPNGQKICKSTGAAGVRTLGLTREALVGRLYSVLVPGDVRKCLTPDEAVEAFVFSWRKDRRLTAEVLKKLDLKPGPPAWKPIRPPSFHKDYGAATSVVWDPDFVERVGGAV
jgi:hypothetical protein